jgi:hypothetical protein
MPKVSLRRVVLDKVMGRAKIPEIPEPGASSRTAHFPDYDSNPAVASPR